MWDGCGCGNPYPLAPVCARPTLIDPSIGCDSGHNVPCGTFDYPPTGDGRLGMYPASESGRGGKSFDYPPQSGERLGSDPSAGLGQDKVTEVTMSEGKVITLAVSGLTVATEGLETYISSLVDEKMGDMDEDAMETIAERVVDDKMPSGYSDPDDYFDMTSYVGSGDFEDLESRVEDLEKSSDETLVARVEALETIIAQLRQVFAPTTGWQSQEVAI